MIYLPLEHLLKIATCQARPGVVIGSQAIHTPDVLPKYVFTDLVDTNLAARMVANGLRVMLRDGVWERHRAGAEGQVGEAKGLRLMVWMDSRDEQPGMVAIWDMIRETPEGQTPYGPLVPRPVLVIGRNVRSGEHFVLRYAPGDWLKRLQQIDSEVQRLAF
jgi:hypothetical protein